MRLESLELAPLDIPFRFAFEHASATRRATETVWVTARARNGVVGLGESCPRGYVTGESVATAAAFLRAHRPALVAEVRSLDDVAGWVEAHRGHIDRNPAAWCAVELALLDALGRDSRASVEALLGLPELDGSFFYTAVVGNVSLERFRATVALYRRLEMTDFKIKLSGRFEDDAAKLSWLEASAGRSERIRVDANNLWSDLDEATAYLEALPRGFFAVEEPLERNRHRDLAELSRRLGVRIVLDESLLRRGQLAELPEAGEHFALNLRVSKMGGSLRSLDVVRAARRVGIPVVVGAQVGETSLLTRAALPIAREAGGLLLAQEGAFGDALLAVDPCEPSLKFGSRGRLAAPPPGPGLGISARSEAQRRGAPTMPTGSPSRMGGVPTM